MMDELADLLLGARCPGCGHPGAGVCRACRTSLSTRARPVTDAPAAGELEVWSAGDYSGPLRELLNAHKERSALGLTGLVAVQLAVAARALLPEAPAGTRVVLVPVPSSPAAVRRRGFDHASAVARRACSRLPSGGQPGIVSRRVLRRRTQVADQSGLHRDERVRNQSDTMVARPPRQGEVAVVTDDICTTGATLAEAARALRAAGWQVLGAAVVAHPDRRL